MEAVFCKTVWLIDDDDLSNYVSRAILNTQNFAESLLTMTTVREALNSWDLAVQGALDFPDFIFLDMEMPGLNGWDFLEAFSRQPDAVKEKSRLYMLSSSIDSGDALRARQYKEVCQFIVKPLSVTNVESIKASGMFLKQGK